MMTHDKALCPCSSGWLYGECCAPYHRREQNPPTPLALMRSRYSAYACGLVDYIIATTHAPSPEREPIVHFCAQTHFKRLEILQAHDSEVHFIAHITQGAHNVTFTEHSHFIKEDGKWLYVNGEVFPGEHR